MNGILTVLCIRLLEHRREGCRRVIGNGEGDRKRLMGVSWDGKDKDVVTEWL